VRHDHVVDEAAPGRHERVGEPGAIFFGARFDRQIADALIARLGWQEQKLIDGSVTSDEVLRGRPFPDLIYKAMGLTHTKDPRRVAKVGDTASDLREGSSAGCGWVIGVTTGAFTRTELLQEEHTHLVENVDEILEIL
jgi:phosphonatase-like hydrolase